MNKYLVLYRAPVSSREQMASATPEQGKAVMDAWMAWSKKTGAALLDLGAPLGTSASVGGKTVEDVGGYSMLQAESLDHARKLLDGHPHGKMPGNSIDLYEVNRIPGM